MKISPKSKKAVAPPTPVAELIAKLLNTPEDDLVRVLLQIDSWKWPRSDLNAWIKVLNKFDDILEGIIREYNLDNIQLKPFSSSAKRMVSEILRFERLLLENSTNRKTFGSYDRLNSLLLTSDLDVLILALNLLLRPSQQYSAQPSVSHALSLSTHRLQSLGKRWPQLRDYGVGLLDLSCKTNSKLEALPPDAFEVNFSFYRTDGDTNSQKHVRSEDVFDVSHGTPRKSLAPTSSGAVNVHLDEKTIGAKSVMNVLSDAMQAHSIPDDEKFELLCRIRVAKVLTKGQEIDREKLVISRLLAIAIYGHTHPESQATTSLFLYEPDLISHIAELLQVDQDVPIHIQTAALAALDALARYRNRIQEVLTAVNAGVNHGILMALFRRTVVDVSNNESTLPHSFVEALLSFVTFIASHASGGNMIVGAGLIPLLIQIIEIKSPLRLPIVSKTMQLVDNVLYGFTNSFNLFCSARGVDVLVERIEYEVDLDIKEYGHSFKSREVTSSSVLPVTRGAVLKHILRSVHRMMQSSGTAEGLRGLIDMSLLKSVKRIIEYRGLFGVSVLPLAINIMATFVHNEPTSLAIIQEAGLPEAFYKAIEIGIEPSIEVIQAIPNAIGALCLNEIGQAQLINRPSIIPAIFSIFASERHLKVLLEKENAVLIGTAIDELIRHHPSLKLSVFEALKSTLSHIEYLGISCMIPDDIRQWYQLQPTPSSTLSTDVDDVMEDLEPKESVTNTAEQIGGSQAEVDEEEEPSGKGHDNVVVSFVDVLGRFLEGLFQHTPHCKDFITTTDGLRRLGRLTGLPCLPYDFASSVASDSMVQVMRTMIEVATSETLLHLAGLVKESLDATHNFWESVDEQSKLLPLIDVKDDDQVRNANERFRSLVTLHIRITLLSDVFATAGYAHGRAAIGLLQTLMSNTSPQVVSDLGTLHRISIWENIALNAGLISKGIEVQITPSESPMENSPSQSTINLNSDVAPNNGFSAINGIQSGEVSANATEKQQPKPLGPRAQNAAAIKHLTHGLPSALAPFFQAMVKMFHARRNPDAAQKKQISESSTVVADIMLKHLTLNISQDRSSVFLYYSVILGLFTLLLVDERTSTSSLHTVQLSAFYRANGLDAIFNVCRLFTSTIDYIISIKEEDRSSQQDKELNYVYGGIKVALHLLLPIISAKPLVESGQTLLIMTRDKKESDPEYFEPHNFLVKLRLASLPLIQGLWNSDWLLQAPLGVIRSITRTVLELINGENEEPKGDIGNDTVSHVTTVPRITGADENRIRMLTDMGFPRSAAERALTRTHNNVNAATEILLSTPFQLQTEPEPVAEQEPELEQDPEAGQEQEHEHEQEQEQEQDGVGGAVSIDEHHRDSEPVQLAVDTTIESTSVTTDSINGKSAEEWRKDLVVAREPLREGLGKRALLLIDEHVSLLFDLHTAFTKSGNAYQQEAVKNIVEDIDTFSPFACDVQEQPIANRCRILALVLCETPSSLDRELRETLLEKLLALLLSSNTESPPRWLAAHLLVVEALFTLAAEPRPIILPKQDEPINSEALVVGLHKPEATNIMFEYCLRLLAVDNLPGDELLSVLRLFVLFTRDRGLADLLVKRDGLSMLFKRVRLSAVPGSSSYIATILRHLAEDTPTLEHIMRQSIKRYFTQPRNRVIDIGTYVKNCSAMALRDSVVFIDSTKSLCQLGHPFSSSPNISLKNEPIGEEKSSQDKLSQGEIPSDMPVDLSSTTSSLPTQSAETIVHLLISEIMIAMKSINDLPSEIVMSSQPAPGSGEAIQQDAGLQDPSVPMVGNDEIPHDKYQYICFLMQCLTELLFSYDFCKVAFLSYVPKKRSSTPAKEQPNKYRTATLHFLLSDLITFGTVNPQQNSQMRNKLSLCNWAMSVIVALCVDSSSQEAKEISPELVSVRKFVLETISRSVKELPPSENADARYGRLLALADLCHRLLTVRFNTASRKQQDEHPTHIAKIMLEKNFVATLTAALSEVDLNYPNVRNLVASILRPLEHLTRIAIKMSKGISKNKDAIESEKTESVSSFESSDEEEDNQDDTGREETPDLYRTSALGMYGGEMDDGQFTSDDDMDVDDDDEGEDAEMEYDEETGSEDTSNTEDEEEPTHLLHHDNESEPWDSDEDAIELLEAQDDVAEDDDEDVDDQGEDGEGDEDEGDENLLWEDIHRENNDIGAPAEDLDDDEDQRVPIQIIHHHGEVDEPEMASDEGEYSLENGIFSGEDVFHFGDFDISNGRQSGGLVIPRRHRAGVDENIQVFGRARNAPAPPPETTIHPLLLDTSSSSNRAYSGQYRGARQGHRVMAGGSTDLFQTIDEMIGGGSVQLFQHVMTRGRGGAGGPETFRLDVPAGTLVNIDRGFLPNRRAPPGVFSAAIRLERTPRPPNQRPGREFDPLLTMQRWAEEVKILHGDFVAERVGKLINHVTLALLPAAVEAINRTKIQKEEEDARQLEIEVKETEGISANNSVDTTAEVNSAQPFNEETIDDITDSSASNQPSMDTAQQDQEMEDVSVPHTSADTIMSDAALDTSGTQATDTPSVAPAPTSDQPGSSAGATEIPPDQSQTSQRITVVIHGSPVDITDTGIDPTFLEALPDDMREEVLNQHVRDQRAARVERPADSQISAEFLDALPPEIRAEIIQQEAVERARRRAEDVAQSNAPSRAPADIDPASFIASLDPVLRQAVLVEQDDGFIQTLPSHLIAEAGHYREGMQPRHHLAARNATRNPPQNVTAMRKIAPQHDAILLLDKTGVAVLVRLLFFPQVLKKTLLFKVLVNLCENAKSRTELFNLLLTVLQDSSGDLSSVDKSFAQMSFRNSKPQTPKSAGKQKAGSDYLNALALSPPHVEAVPDLIAQRCLESLTYIVSSNEFSSLFFLTEHELPAGLRKVVTKKGKGKEKSAPHSHYPIILLLSLLDRQSLLRTPAIMESVVSLLANVTRPLTTLKNKIGPVQTELFSTSVAPPAEGVAPGSNLETSITPLTSPEQPQQTAVASTEETSVSVAEPAAPSEETVEEKILLANPPQIPHSVLRLIVNILTVGECSGRTFQQSLALIQHLSYIPDARDVIANELKSKAQEFGQTLFSDLAELAKALQSSQNEVILSSVAAKFSPASSTQAKLLRVLKTIDYMYTPRSPTSEVDSDEDIEKVQAIYESFRFTSLWQKLGECLSVIEEKSETEHIATVLLPLIEALMVVCKYVGSKVQSITVARALRGSTSPRSPTTPRESMEDLFISFTDAHRKVLNLMVRNNPSLMSGSFSLLVNNPRVLDFDNKRNYFNQQLHRRSHTREHHGTIQLNVRRARVFEDSFQHLQRKTGDQIKYGKLSVRFYEEEGVDAGGVTREWFQILARQMFDPNNALFQPCAADKLTYQPNKNSWVNPEHLSFFKFVGRVIGKAIYDGRLLDAYFARSLYRQLLGKPVDYKDVEWVDPEYYNSLCWILENDPTVLDLTFSVEADEFGINRIIPLKEGGEQTSVTQENKREYVQLSAQYRLYSSIKDQIESLSNGFYEIIPKDLITIFNEQELELLISGTPDIDVDEWRAATEYNGYTSSDPNIVWWWRALKSFNRDERAKVLSFATGTSRVPLSGFVDLQGVQGVQRFSIHRAYGEPDRLPQAHTCFNQIDLPQYTSYEMLRQQLVMAISEGGEGFAFS